MDNKEELSEEMFELFERAREIAFELSTTKNEKVPLRKSLNNKKTNKKFDIDIFFSRKPGMRRSVQVVTSNAPTKEDIKVSCLVAIASICDTMISNKQLNVTKEDIVKAFIAWMEQNGVRLVNTKNTGNFFQKKMW